MCPAESACKNINHQLGVGRRQFLHKSKLPTRPSEKCEKKTNKQTKMFAVYSSPFAAKALSLHGNRMKLLRRNHQRQQYVDTLATRNAANYHNNLIMHRHRMRQLYSPICEHETRHCHEIANHYKDWCRSRIGRRAKKRTKRMVNARAADSCLPQRETLQIPCFDYPRYYLLCV